MQQGHCLSEITGAIYYEEIKDQVHEAAWLVSLLSHSYWVPLLSVHIF